MNIPEYIDDSYRSLEEVHGMLQRHILDMFPPASPEEMRSLQADITRVRDSIEHITERYGELLDELVCADPGMSLKEKSEREAA